MRALPYLLLDKNRMQKNKWFEFSGADKETWRQFVEITKPYWTSNVKSKAFMLLGILLLLLLAVNGLNVVINYVSGAFMTAFSSKDQPTFYRMLIMYFSVFVVGTPIVVFYSWMGDKLGLHWRSWLTEHLLGKYLTDRAYYRIANDKNIDNPDERISQDVRDFTRGALTLLLNILSSVVTLLSFIAILWSISHELIGIVFVYAAAGTLSTVWLGRRLISLKFNQLKKEADFRYNLIHVRNNVESIAFYQGELEESKSIRLRFADAVSNFNVLIGWQRNVSFLTTGYNYLIVLIPSLIIAPLYFAGKVPFGAQTQADMAFGQILTALSLVVTSFDDITALVAQIKRLGTFNDSLSTPDAKCGAQIETAISPRFELNDLTLSTPNGNHVLVRDLRACVSMGSGLLIMGPSGIGKSSLLRAVGGLWNNGSGIISRPELSEVMFLPQRPYMTLGSLRRQLLYPRMDADVGDAELNAVLEQVNLADLTRRVGGLDVELSWTDLLSLGEQQRISFARVLLSNAKYVILDEATSALDVENEKQLYSLLQSRQLTYISVGHRPTLAQYHDTILELKGDNDWTAMSSAQADSPKKLLDNLREAIPSAQSVMAQGQ